MFSVTTDISLIAIFLFFVGPAFVFIKTTHSFMITPDPRRRPFSRNGLNALLAIPKGRMIRHATAAPSLIIVPETKVER